MRGWLVAVYLVIVGVYLSGRRPPYSYSNRQNTLLVIAHPDDEVMFFGPALNYFRGESNLHVLCLSTGNSNGLGIEREQELYRSLRVFGVENNRIRVVDDALLEDGMDWSTQSISSSVTEYTNAHNIHTVLTFDQSGVSSHPNHIALNKGVTAIETVDIRKCFLRTHSIPIKFSSFTYPLQTSELSISSTFTEYASLNGIDWDTYSQAVICG
ncbi:hypothetical protein E3P86_03032 [Wallemia ichthyophaga]|uniref:N-acetylglucosaminylphosphatidylinositol deacetylase n=1 Tax=Wallemia ichthyophaga TaxID=245174 RepID=A0A4T0ISR7_WALIC|nr:hypothetical protein E3P86_03032 [Wallemia ichthyophaga]